MEEQNELSLNKTKRCTKCGKIRFDYFFHKMGVRNGKQRYNPQCKDCKGKIEGKYRKFKKELLG